jgi:hypothetical protein
VVDDGPHAKLRRKLASVGQKREMRRPVGEPRHVFAAKGDHAGVGSP